MNIAPMRFRIAYEIPEVSDQDKADKIIFGELVNGVFSEESRKEINKIIQKLAGGKKMSFWGKELKDKERKRGEK